MKMFDSLKYNQSTIHFGQLLDSPFQQILNEEFKDCKKVIITDERVFELWIEDLITNCPALSKAEIIQIPAGEEFKTIEVCAQIWEALSEYKISRNDLIINFGGGVITDLGGFVASVFKRGMQFINVPTTLLSQVDASVGGKTGIDLGPFKNQVGVFADASYVFIDERFLDTLKPEQVLSGYAEMLKHGLIADAAYWNDLKDFDPLKKEGRLDFVYRSVKLKKSVVEKDHKENGLRKILNYGHSVGHGMEGFLLESNNPTLHGYAVAQGMLAEAYISLNNEMISENELTEIKDVIDLKFPKLAVSKDDFKRILTIMHNDKKNQGDIMRFSLLKGIGNCVVDQEVSDRMVLDALNEIV